MMSDNLEFILSDVIDALSGIDEAERSEEVGETIQAVIEDLKSVRDSVRSD